MANITVRRANVILTVPDYQQNEYLAKGFDVIGSNGKVLIRTVPNDVNSLKKALSEALEQLKKLEAENAKLKKKLSSSKVTKVETEEVEEPDETLEEIPEETQEVKEKFTPINKRAGAKKKK